MFSTSVVTVVYKLHCITLLLWDSDTKWKKFTWVNARKMKNLYVADSIFDTKYPDMIHNYKPIP